MPVIDVQSRVRVSSLPGVWVVIAIHEGYDDVVPVDLAAHQTGIRFATVAISWLTLASITRPTS